MCVVGDFTEQEVESCLLDYLGTVTPNSDEQLRWSVEAEKPVLIDAHSTPELRHQQVRHQNFVLHLVQRLWFLAGVVKGLIAFRIYL